MLATTSDDGTSIVWDVASGDAARDPRAATRARFRRPVFSGDGKTLYTASHDGTAIAWNVAGDRRVGQAFNEDPTPRRSAPGAVGSLDGELISGRPPWQRHRPARRAR